ncbi:MAG: hypothetical protein LBP50_09225 [Tannerella sp.]|jgi:hypothetical protein|nr:hypothetical protein [Tannerella sp.]
MKKRIVCRKVGMAVLALGLALHVTGARESRLDFRDGKAEIVLADPLEHPLYEWPETLLSYEVFSDVPLSDTDLCLTDRESGRQIPFQWVPSYEATRATLYVFSGLKPGESRTMVLQRGKPEYRPPMQVENDGVWITVTTSRFSVRLPAARTDPSGEVPGPVSGFSGDRIHWLGHAFFEANSAPLRSLEVRSVSVGALFAEFELVYLFADGAEYKARVRCVEGYDFVELREWMDGFGEGKHTAWRLEWTRFAPTHRQAPNHPYGAPKKEASGFGRYDWETVGQTMLDSHHGINRPSSADGRIPFELGIFGNWPAETNLTSAVFWDEKTDRSIGAFVQDMAFWNDRQYAIWHDTRVLSIKFFYRDSLLRWSYPVRNGTRSTAISFYPHSNDIRYMEELEALTKPRLNRDSMYCTVKMSQLSYISFLQNRHSTLDLNVVKTWQLTYPEEAAIPAPVFNARNRGTVRDFMQRFFYGAFSNELAVSGPCQNSGYGPTASRAFYDSYTDRLLLLLPEMTREERRRMIAMFLLHTYVAAGEEYMPMRHMLSGHPNFLSDVKSVPAFAAFLFPEHPRAQEWADLFEKYIDLNSHYHTRPHVRAWDATGGRWTENLNTYLWAFIRPAIRADYALGLRDGKKRMAGERMAMIGAYVMNALSAPVGAGSFDPSDRHHWGAVTPERAPARVIPPRGAHAVRRMLPAACWLLGKEFENYDPLLSENLRYLARPDFQDAGMSIRDENAFSCMYPTDTDDSGTPPQLESIKLTGHGIILRAAVGTDDELSIHLGQIDNGPNYRWGIAGQGGCGVIYFYAGGKSYSDNGKEDVGDRRLQDTDLTTNFGVFKDGRFKSVGKNELTEPFYDLSVGQFAEIRASETKHDAWPEYQGRSILLVGSDYFLIYDDVYNRNISGRFSWFTRPDEPLPELEVLKGGGADYTYSTKKPEFVTHSGRESRGVWFDGTGDFLTFVSHRKGYRPQATPYGCIVRTPEGYTDYVFRNDLPVDVREEGCLFSGTAGLIRRKQVERELAVFHGSRIGADGFEMQIRHLGAGLSAVFTDPVRVRGRFYCKDAAEVTFKWEKGLPPALHCYADGEELPVVTAENGFTVTFPAGKHVWNISDGLPVLPVPRIAGTRNRNGQVEVTVVPVAGASGYRFEYSTDAGKNWTAAGEQSQPKRVFRPRSGEAKGYVRIAAVNREHASPPSIIYPVYFTTARPHFPDGLRVVPEKGQTCLHWGKVLGCDRYGLYRRNREGQPWKRLYFGSDTRFVDPTCTEGMICEYAVSAFNGNGESDRSHAVTTDPLSWLNFVPVANEPFRRVIGGENPVDNDGNATPTYYPE